MILIDDLMFCSVGNTSLASGQLVNTRNESDPLLLISPDVGGAIHYGFFSQIGNLANKSAPYRIASMNSVELDGTVYTAGSFFLGPACFLYVMTLNPSTGEQAWYDNRNATNAFECNYGTKISVSPSKTVVLIVSSLMNQTASRLCWVPFLVFVFLFFFLAELIDLNLQSSTFTLNNNPLSSLFQST